MLEKYFFLMPIGNKEYPLVNNIVLYVYIQIRTQIVDLFGCANPQYPPTFLQ